MLRGVRTRAEPCANPAFNHTPSQKKERRVALAAFLATCNLTETCAYAASKTNPERRLRVPASAPNWSGRPQVATRKVRSGCYRKGQPKYQNTRAPQRTSRAALRLQPLRRGEVAVLCGGGTGILIPRTALRLQPLQRGEVRQRKRERVGGGSRKAWLCLEVWVWVGGSGRGVMEGCSVLPGARACWTIGHGEDRRRLPCEPPTAEGGAARRPTHPMFCGAEATHVAKRSAKLQTPCGKSGEQRLLRKCGGMRGSAPKKHNI